MIIKVQVKNYMTWITIFTFFSLNNGQDPAQNSSRNTRPHKMYGFCKHDFVINLIPFQKGTFKMKRKNFQLKFRHAYLKSETNSQMLDKSSMGFFFNYFEIVVFVSLQIYITFNA